MSDFHRISGSEFCKNSEPGKVQVHTHRFCTLGGLPSSLVSAPGSSVAGGPWLLGGFLFSLVLSALHNMGLARMMQSLGTGNLRRPWISRTA